MLSFLLLFSCKEPMEEQINGDPVDLLSYVNPFIATGGIGYSVGCAYPGASLPFSMIKLSPDTATEYGANGGYYRGGGYHYDDRTIQGFSHMHLHGPGLTDYGVLSVMPVNQMNSEKTTRLGYNSAFSHDDEHAEVGLYTVDLDVAHVRLSATEHTGLHEYTFKGSEPALVIDVGHKMGRGIVSQGEIALSEDAKSFEGSLVMRGEISDDFPIFFYGEFDQPAQNWGVWQGESYVENQHQANIIQNTSDDSISLGLWVTFPAQSKVHLRVALSNVDIEGAKANFETEHRGFEIEQDHQNAKETWQTYFDAIRVWGGDERERTIFATALYHTLQMPTLYSDVDGRYRGFDQEIHTSERPYYSDFSLWDTYRTTHPLYTLLWPEKHKDLLWSLSKMTQQGNGLARWPIANTDSGVMLGTSANIVLSEAALKGLDDFEVESFYEISKAAMLQEHELTFGAPPDLSLLDTYGYYPSDLVGRSVAWNQEQSIADYALANLAYEMGDSDASAYLLERSQTWKNLYDPEIGFFHARHSNGDFEELRSESAWGDEYAEGNARQYLWLVPHTPEDLFETLGGQDESLKQLEEMFSGMLEEIEDGHPISVPEIWYWHGNEPGLHIPYLFALLGQPQQTNSWVDWLMFHRYKDTPDGLAGNDDGGTLSAWYVFSSIGLYPLAGTTRYIIGAPSFDRIEFQNEDAPKLIQRSKQDINYEVLIDEQKWTKWDIRHFSLKDSEIHFQ